MKNGICPRCDKSEVYMQKASHFQSDMVTLKPAAVLGKSTFPDRYICVGCGYVEYYVTSDDDLQMVRETWEKVRS